MRLTKTLAYMGEKRNAYSILIPKPERAISLGRPRCIWNDNIKIYVIKL
jgi:hypothetical protein